MHSATMPTTDFLSLRNEAQEVLKNYIKSDRDFDLSEIVFELLGDDNLWTDNLHSLKELSLDLMAAATDQEVSRKLGYHQDDLGIQLRRLVAFFQRIIESKKAQAEIQLLYAEQHEEEGDREDLQDIIDRYPKLN